MSKRSEVLRETVSLDRSVYLFGEDVQATMTVVNPTDHTVEVLDPFPKEIESEHPNGATWESDVYHECPEPIQERPIVRIAPGQQMKHSYRVVVNQDAPGLHRLMGWRNEFQIIAAQVGEISHVRLSKPYMAIDYRTKQPQIDPKTGKQIEYPRESIVLTVSAGEKYDLLVTQKGRVANRLDIGEDKQLNWSLARALEPLVRVTESDGPIDSVTAIADPDENITIYWKTADGQLHSARLKSDGEVVATPEP